MKFHLRTSNSQRKTLAAVAAPCRAILWEPLRPPARLEGLEAQARLKAMDESARAWPRAKPCQIQCGGHRHHGAPPRTAGNLTPRPLDAPGSHGPGGPGPVAVAAVWAKQPASALAPPAALQPPARRKPRRKPRRKLRAPVPRHEGKQLVAELRGTSPAAKSSGGLGSVDLSPARALAALAALQ